MGDEAKIRKRGYYAKASQGKRMRQGHYLDAGMKGFLITCNNREREVVREAYNLFNEYADSIYGPELDITKNAEAEMNDGDTDEEDDIETALQREVSSLKKKRTQRRFQVVDSGAKNCVFIKTSIQDPNVLIHKLMSDVSETKQAKSRFMMRVHPVIGTCRTEGNKVLELTERCLSQYMETGVPKTYYILIKVRNNNSFGKSQIFPVMRQVIQDMNPGHDFDDKKPDYVFSMDVIKNICCMSVMEDFHKFRKYNIQEISKVTELSPSDNQDLKNVPEILNETCVQKCESVDFPGDTGNSVSAKLPCEDLVDDSVSAESVSNETAELSGNGLIDDLKNKEDCNSTATEK